MESEAPSVQRHAHFRPCPSGRLRRTSFCILLLASLSGYTIAQVPTSQSTEGPTATDTGLDSWDNFEVPVRPAFLSGLNASVNFTGVHESTTGWATLFTPAICYTFNHIFSADASMPIYAYRLADSRDRHPKPDAHLVTQRGEPGDIIFGLHAQFVRSRFLYQSTAAFTAPTGDQTYGLTTGRVTFDFNNHFEHAFGRYTTNVEFGAGDSTTLVNRILNKNYTSLGPLAHFQAGLEISLVRGTSFETDAYEQLPIGDQKIYRPSRRSDTMLVTGHNAIEDNGFISALDVPLDRHTILSGYYSRSLRLHTDTAAVGVTYILRGAPREEDISLDDLFR